MESVASPHIPIYPYSLIHNMYITNLFHSIAANLQINSVNNMHLSKNIKSQLCRTRMKNEKCDQSSYTLRGVCYKSKSDCKTRLKWFTALSQSSSSSSSWPKNTVFSHFAPSNHIKLKAGSFGPKLKIGKMKRTNCYDTNL